MRSNSQGCRVGCGPSVWLQRSFPPRIRARFLCLPLRVRRLAFCSPCFLAPIGGWTCRLSTIAGCGLGLVAIRKIVGHNDRVAADLHFSGQSVEALACLPAAIDLRRNLLVLRYEQLAGLTRFAATPIATARWPLPSAVVVKGVADDLLPNSTSTSRSFGMMCSACSAFPRGISCPPLVAAIQDSRSRSGLV
jgi:hypothetical protein